MTRTVLALALALAWAPRVEAHQLDEYLQAARLALSRDRVEVELDLTPSVSIASQIFAIVDSDGDGRAAPQEIERYARRVIDDLSLRVDGRPYSVILTRAESSSRAEIQEGMGRFRIEAFAELSTLIGGRHRVAFENRHQPANGVYLVNALVPEDDRIRIRGQRRDELQHAIELDVDVTAALSSAIWLSLACTGLTGLVVARRRGGRHSSLALHRRGSLP